MSVNPAAPARPRLSGHLFPDLAIIAAVASNGVIGVAGGLPWRLSDDLKRFRTLTLGHAVIMGRKTWESLRGPLPDRQNIVVTSRAGYAAPGAEVATGLDDALARVEMPPPAFCIGGADLYRAALPRASSLHLTEIECSEAMLPEVKAHARLSAATAAQPMSFDAQGNLPAF